MATADAQDGSEHVTDFLKRIKELGQQRDQEDTERTRKLEEQIAEARRQREERRRERARSLSPEKQTPATPRSLRSPRSEIAGSPLNQPRPLQSLSQALDDKPDFSPRKDEPSGVDATSSTPQAVEEQAQRPASPSRTDAPTATSLARSGTLSWQQRPAGGLKGPRARPAAFLQRREPAKVTDETPTATSHAEEPSRADIAKSLSTRNPDWFKQTADRGVGSAAFRRNESESAESTPSQKRQLHGLSNARSTPDPDESVARSSATPTSQSPSFMGSMRGKPSMTEPDTSIMSESLESVGDSTENVPYGSMRGHHGSESESTIGRRNEGSLPRSGSPTKGMGGFVSSAMMRRTDSVSRRWNVPNGPSLSRQNSSAGYSDRPASRDRAAVPPVGMPRLEESNTFKRPASRGQSSRPSSSHGSVQQPSQENDDSFARPASPDRSRAKTIADPRMESGNGVKSPDEGLQPSPSKRWSPTKSSWLESALSKPDQQRAKPPPPTQPAWMANLQKNKQQKQSRDIDQELKNDADKDLGRSAPLWGASIKTRPVETPASQPMSPKPEASTSTAAPVAKPKPPRFSDSPETEESQADETAASQVTNHNIPDKDETKHPLRPTQSLPESQSTPNPPPPMSHDRRDDSPIQYPSQFEAKLQSKSKPSTPPKPDFRSNLKPRAESPTKSEFSQPEFLSAAGNLRRSNTQKYVAPDLLGDNIRRGKAGLNLTGGPKPTQRRDEFKDSLVSQKQRMQEKAIAPGVKPAVPEKRQASIPEALRKREALGRNDSNANLMSRPSPEKAQAGASMSLQKKQVEREADAPSPTKSPGLENGAARSAPAMSAKLAGFYNPAIANVLARGPPKSPSSERNQTSFQPLTSAARVQGSQEADGSQPLEHKTKGRARGPKRRLPKALEGSEDAVKPSSPAPNVAPMPAIGAKPAVRSSSRKVSQNLGAV